MSRSESDDRKTRDELIAELAELRRQLGERNAAGGDGESKLCAYLALAYHTLDRAGQLLDVNTAWLELLGYDREEVVGRPFSDFLAPVYRPEFACAFEQVKSTGQCSHFEFDMEQKSGDLIRVAITGRTVHDQAGRLVRTDCVLYDLTERAKVTRELQQERQQLALQLETREKELDQTEGFYHDILEGILNGVWVSDRDDNLYYVNQSMTQIAGIAADQLLGVNVLTGFREETLHHFRPLFLEAKQTLQPVRYDAVPVTTPSGRLSFQAGWLTPRIRDGEYDGMICTVADVTEHVEMARALEEERLLLHTLLDSLPDHIFVKDHEARFVLNNRNHLRAMGAQTQEEVLGKTDMDVFPTEFAEKYMQDDMAVIATGEPVRDREEIGVNERGEHIVILTTKLPLHDSQGKVKGLVGIAHDISDLKHTEEELRRHRDQLEELVVERTAELAHERDLLQAMMDHVPDLIYFKDRESRFIRNSHSHLTFMGIDDPEFVVGKTDFDMFSTEHAEQALRMNSGSSQPENL